MFVTKYGEGQRCNSLNQLAHSHTYWGPFSHEISSRDMVLDQVVPIQDAHALLVQVAYFLLANVHLQNGHDLVLLQKKMSK